MFDRCAICNTTSLFLFECERCKKKMCGDHFGRVKKGKTFNEESGWQDKFVMADVCKICEEVERQQRLAEMRIRLQEQEQEKREYLSRVKMYAYGSPMSRTLANTEGIEELERGRIDLIDYPDRDNYEVELTRMTLEKGGDTLINLRVKPHKYGITASAVVLKLDWEKTQKG